MTHLVLTVLLHWHLAVVPIFVPKVSNIHDAQLTVSYAPRWKRIFQTQELEAPNGAMVIFRHSFSSLD